MMTFSDKRPMSAPIDPRRVIVATDLSPSAAAVAQYAALFARAVGASLHLVHYESPLVAAPVEAGSLFQFSQSVAESNATTSAQLALLAESVEQHGLPVHAAVIDAPRRYLVEQVVDNDILVLGTSPRGWLSMYLRPSFLSRCLSAIPGGLLLVPESAKAPGIDTVLCASGDASWGPVSSYAVFLSERLGAKWRVLAEFPSPLASAGAAYARVESPLRAAITASNHEARTLIVTPVLKAETQFTRAERVAYERLLRSSRSPVLLMDESIVPPASWASPTRRPS